MLIPLVMGKWTPMIALGYVAGRWIIAACATAIAHRFQATPAQGFFAKLKANRSSYYGMHLAHVGVAVFVIGVAMVKGYETERDVRMAPGQTVTEGGFDFKFVNVSDVRGPNYTAIAGRFEVSKNGKLIEVMTPEKRTYFASGQTMTEASIDSGFVRGSLCGARRTGRKRERWRMGCADLREAFHQLDLGRLPADGHRRRTGDDGPSLPH